MLAFNRSFPFSSVYSTHRTEEQYSYVRSIAHTVHHRPDQFLVQSIREIDQGWILGDRPERFRRLVLRLAALDPSFPQNLIRERLANIEFHEFTERAISEACLQHAITIHPAGSRLIASVLAQESLYQKYATDTQLFDDTINRFRTDAEMVQLLSGLEVLPEDPQSAERLATNLLGALRRILSSPLYGALSYDERHPFTRMIHDLVISQYDNVHMRNALLGLAGHLGAKDLRLHDRIYEIWIALNTVGVSDSTIRSLLRSSWRQCTRVSMEAIARCVTDALPPLGHVFLPEERTLHANIPGNLFGERKITKGLVSNQYTICLPTPIFRGLQTPEFRAALQAMENAQYSDDADLRVRPSAWLYTHFLSEDWEESTALLATAEEFPFSAHVMILPKDPPGGSSSLFPRNASEIREAMFQNIAYSSTEFAAKHALYALPGTLDESQWQDLVSTMAKKSLETIAQTDHVRSLDDNSRIIAGYELFQMQMIECHEEIALALQAQRMQRNHLTIFRSTADKKSVDIGARATALYISIMGHTAEQSRELAIGTLFGRPLLTCRRSIDREDMLISALLLSTFTMKQLKSLILHVPKPDPGAFLRPAGQTTQTDEEAIVSDL